MQVPAAHPRRSIFAIQVEGFLSRGIKFGTVDMKRSSLATSPTELLFKSLPIS